MCKYQRILEAAQNAEASLTGKLGFAFYDLQEGKGCYLHENEIFPTASVYKVYILAELYRQAAEGIVDLDAYMSTPTENLTMGSGILSLLSPGLSLRVRDFAKLMMMLSDNVATDIIFGLVGRENIIENVLKPLGLTKTKADFDCTTLQDVYYRVPKGATKAEWVACARSDAFRNAPEYTGQMEMDCCTSPHDMTAMFKLLYDGKWVSKAVCDEMLSIMRPQPAAARIGTYLPKNVVVARKTGSLDRIVNDAGIVFSPNGAYVLVTFYNGNVASEEEYLSDNKWLLGSEMIAQLSKKIYDIMQEG